MGGQFKGNFWEEIISCFPLVDEVEVEVNLRPTVSRPVRLGVRHPSGTGDQFFFLLDIFVRHLQV
jgi:hypothetical protein